MRATHRSLLITLIAAVAALAVAATAVAVPAGTQYSGSTKHKHYGLTVNTTCTAVGCQKATKVSVEITEGSQAHPHAACAYNDVIVNAKLKNGKFSVKQKFAKKHITVSVSGAFGSGKVKGKVTGPKACGGTDSYSLKAQPNGGY
jgi:hypothetical protein